MLKILFVLKFRELPASTNWGDGQSGQGQFLSSGLYNSANFVTEMLKNVGGVRAKLVHVIDNNYIHRAIVEWEKEDGIKVSHVVVEALWVVAEKFDELKRVCPHIKWIIRNHSETPFLASEGLGFARCMQYVERENVFLSCNAPRMLKDIRFLLKVKFPEWTEEQIAYKTPYLPNYYPIANSTWSRLNDKEYIDIACYGAVRPLKNHVIQVIAALKVATSLNKLLRFHINFRTDNSTGDPILNSIRGIFNQLKDTGHILVEDAWRPHGPFKQLVQQMDIVTQVSFSETFNIVAADAVSQGVCTVTSDEIVWSSKYLQANPTDSDDCARVMLEAYRMKMENPSVNLSLSGLHRYNEDSKKVWFEYFGINPGALSA